MAGRSRKGAWIEMMCAARLNGQTASLPQGSVD